MARLPEPICSDPQEAMARRAHQAALNQALEQKLEQARAGGGAQAQQRQKARGKLTVAERLDALLDPQAPFLSLSSLAGCAREHVPAGAGIVTGIGQVAGKLCMVIANDASVKGGSYFPETVKKHVRAQAIALEQRLPCLYLVDSGGIFLPEQAACFADADHFGRIFANQARMSAAQIPQIAVVLGLCTAGGAYVPAMADENIVVKNQSTIYLAGPPLVRAATGEEVDAESLGGALMHSQVAGTADHIAENEHEALRLCRRLVSQFTDAVAPPPAQVPSTARPPKAAVEDVALALPTDLRQRLAMPQVLACLLDDSHLEPFRPLYGPTLICGLGRIEGQTVGIVANDGILFGESAQKGAHFINLCSQRGHPLLFVQHIAGFMVGRRAEQGGIAKDGAKMVQAVSCARVPKITLIVGASHGAGNYAMCGRGFQPDFLFTWPQARISVMGPEQAADVMVEIKKPKEEEEGPMRRQLVSSFAQTASSTYATSNLWDDGVISPQATRRTLGLALSICGRLPPRQNTSPVFRM